MNQIDGLLLLAGIPLALLVAGYWLAAAFTQSELTVRLSIALLTGIASLLFMVSAVNYFFPLSGLAAWGCLAPVFASLLGRKSRTLLGQDLSTLVQGKPAWVYGSIVGLFFLLLMWPVLSSNTTMMYDGTSNHDSFFWVVVAEHLKRHTYMERPVWSALQPLASAADAVVGWTPAWGRMGSEGLLALCSSVVGLSPLKLYVYVTACLFLPWLAVVHLGIRTFYAERLSWPAQVAVLILHPVYIFYYSNSNLPNLLGVLAGSTAIIATESALRADRDRPAEMWGWSGLLCLSLHGLYCSYPEMIPFVFMPCGLLWLRACFTAKARSLLWRPRLIVAGAVVVSLLLNPASTFRAWWGFFAVYHLTQVSSVWGSIMYRLHPAQYLPTLVTLAPSSAKWLGVWIGGGLSCLIVLGAGLAWRRARDPLGAFIAFSGGCSLLLYTILANFVYGWQKSVQFAGIFVSALLAGAIIDALFCYRNQQKGWNAIARLAALALAFFLAFAFGMQCRETYKWSDQKLLSQDWFALREQSYTSLLRRPVLVEAATFRMGFYHSMWAAYFLPESYLYYGIRGEQSGGYLRGNVINEATQNIPAPDAVLVSRSWANSFETNSPHLLEGREYVLVRKSNRFFGLRGVYPLYGIPDLASSLIELELLPHSTSELQVELAPRVATDWPVGRWQVTRRAEGSEDFSMEVSGTPPWTLKVPLIAGRRNQIALSISPGKGTAEPLPFDIKVLRIRGDP